MASRCIHTPTFRFKLVDKTSGTDGVDYGDGTLFPLKVTHGQLAELMFRVKRAWFTAGSVSCDVGEEASVGTSTASIQTGSTYGPSGVSNNAWSDSTIIISGEEKLVAWRIGYVAGGSATSLADPVLPNSMFGTEYSIDVEFSWGNSHSVTTSYHRDASDDEWVLWFFNDNTDQWHSPTWTGYWSEQDGTFPYQYILTGFSQEMLLVSGFYDYDLPNTYYHYKAVVTFAGPPPFNQYMDTNVCLRFTGEVAWRDINASGNPFDPANELYVGMWCAISGDGYIPFLHTYKAALSPASSSPVCDLEFQAYGFTSPPVKCPLYYQTDAMLINVTGSNFVVTADEWWPYKKGPTPGSAVWSTTTGAPL